MFFSGSAVCVSLRAAYLIMAALFVVSVVGCGSDGGATQADGDASSSSSAAAEEETEDSGLIVHPGLVYSLDDFVGVGWKKSDQLSTETLANATDVWYGFYNQKDIEIRFYVSHEAAVEHGVGPAKETVARGGGARGGAHAVWTPNIALYGAYAVAGNVVMMCELDITPCEALVDALERL